MSEASTRLVLDNATEHGNVLLTMRMNNGQYMEFCLAIKPDSTRTVHQIELAVLRQAQMLIEHMLKE